MMERQQTFRKRNTIFLKTSLVAFSLGFLSIVLSLVLGNSAFNSSITEFEAQYRNVYLREAKTLAEIARMGGASDAETLLEELRRIYAKTGIKPADEYLCIVDRNANLIAHTAHPDTIGNYAGKNPIFGETDSPEKCLADLVASKKDYVGDYVSSSGQSQLAAFAAVPDRHWVVGIHRSKQALINHIEAGIKYSKTGFYIVCGALMPLSLSLIFLTFYFAERKRRRTEDALRESDEKIRNLVETTKDWVWEIDVKGVHTYSNEALSETLGYAATEIIGGSAFPLMHPDDQQNWKTKLPECVAQNTGWHNEPIRWIAKSGETRWFESSATPVCDIKGAVIGFRGIDRDITDRMQIQAALEKRMIALTRPLDSAEGVAFTELFNLEDIQRLQDQFAAATGVASIITDTDGTPITRPSKFCRLCSDIIRKTDKGLANCIKSDAVLGRWNPDGPTIQPCLSGGLWDAGAGISVGGRHIANWLIGQVRDETQTDEQMRVYANKIGAEEEAVIEAFHEVPAMSREKFGEVAQALHTLANQLSETAYQNIQQARFISDKQRAEVALKESKAFLDNMSDIAYTADDQGNVSWVNPAIERVTGFPPEEIIGKPFLPLFVEADHASLMDVYTRTMGGESLENTLTFTSGVTCHFTSLPKRDRQGSIIGTFGVARDISKRLAAERSLAVSEETYRNLLNNLNAGVVVHAPDTSIRIANPMACSLLGLSEDQMLGKAAVDPYWKFLRDDGSDMPLDEYPVNRVLAAASPLHNLVVGVKRSAQDDVVWVLVNGFARTNDSNQVEQVIISFVDISKIKQAQQAIVLSNEKMRLAAESAHFGIWDLDIKNNRL